MYLWANINFVSLLDLALPPPLLPLLLLFALPPLPLAGAHVVIVVVALLLLLWSCSGDPILKMGVH